MERLITNLLSNGIKYTQAGGHVLVRVDTRGTGRISEAELSKLVRKHFQLTPKEIIEELNLRRPIYKATASYGHFGRTGDGFTWELTDKADALRAAAGV